MKEAEWDTVKVLASAWCCSQPPMAMTLCIDHCLLCSVPIVDTNAYLHSKPVVSPVCWSEILWTAQAIAWLHEHLGQHSGHLPPSLVIFQSSLAMIGTNFSHFHNLGHLHATFMRLNIHFRDLVSFWHPSHLTPIDLENLSSFAQSMR